jgi:phage tail sheath protein FI
VRDISGFVRAVSVLEQESLSPAGINVVREFGSGKARVWGARTLAATDASWKYVNVRRLFNMIETSIRDGTLWVRFEPNDAALWGRVTRTVESFLLGLWRQGALFGETASESFQVKCDADTNPPEARDEGKLIIDVAVAPVRPGEFVIFRITQKSQTD